MHGYVPEDLDNQVPSEGPDDSSGVDGFTETVGAICEPVIEGEPGILTAGLPSWTGETWDGGPGAWARLEAGWNRSHAVE